MGFEPELCFDGLSGWRSEDNGCFGRVREFSGAWSGTEQLFSSLVSWTRLCLLSIHSRLSIWQVYQYYLLKACRIPYARLPFVRLAQSISAPVLRIELSNDLASLSRPFYHPRLHRPS